MEPPSHTPPRGSNEPTLPVGVSPHTTTPPAGVPLPPRTEFGEYEVLDEIAAGGMGVVYRARQKSLGRVVALKTLRSGVRANGEELARFRREAETAARLVHPNIVPIHDVGVVDGVPFFSMDYIEGKPMATLLEEGKLDLRSAMGILEKTCRAMHYAHQHGVVHRDLKPANILVDSTGEPRLADFGVAKSLFGEATLTREGTIMGTPNYLAPEQLGGSGETVDARADVYALGVTMYHVLTGRVPFQGTSEIELVYKILQEEPRPPREVKEGVPPELEAICLKAMQKERDYRYGSALEMAEELSRWLARQPVLTRPESITQKTMKVIRRKRGAIAMLLSGVALGAVAMAVAFLPQRGRSSPEAPVAARPPAPPSEPIGARPFEVDAHTVALWHFDEGRGDLAKDAGPGHHDAQLKNGAEWGEGRFGNAIRTGYVGGAQVGTAAYAVVADDAKLDLSERFTVECWMKPLQLGTAESFVWSKYVYKDGLGPALSILGIGDPAYGAPILKVGTRANGYLQVRGAANSVALGEWHHVAATYDGETFRLWLDGKALAEQRAKDAIPNAARIALAIGTSSDLVGWNAFDGWIDEMRISDVARTEFPSR